MKTKLRIFAFLLLCIFAVAAFTSCLNETSNGGQESTENPDQQKEEQKSDPAPADDPEEKGDNPEEKGDDPEEKGDDPTDNPAEPSAISVIFDPANGESPVTVSLLETEVLNAPDTPEKEGYAFLGWFAEGEEEAYVFSDLAIGKTEDFTLTAKWEMDAVPFAWRDFIPYHTEVALSISDFDFTLVKNEEKVSDTLADVHLNDSSAYLFVDGEGYVKAALDGSGNFKIMGEQTDADLTAVMKEGNLYLLLTTNGKEYTVNCDPYTFLDVAFADLTWNDILDGNEDAVSFVSKMLLPILKSGTDTGAIDIRKIADKADFLFDVFEGEDVTTYTLNMTKFIELNNNLQNLSLKACIDQYFGKGTYSTVSALIERALGLKVKDLMDYAERLNLDEDQVIDIANKLAQAAGREDFDLADYVDDRKYNYTSVLSLIIDDEERTDYIETLADQIITRGNVDSFYTLLNAFFADGEDSEADAYVTMKDFLDKINVGFTYSFDVAEDEIVAVRFLLPSSSYQITEEYQLSFGISTEMTYSVEETDHTDTLNRILAKDLGTKTFSAVSSEESEDGMQTDKTLSYSGTESSVSFERTEELAYREEVALLGECACILHRGMKTTSCEDVYLIVTMQTEGSDEITYMLSGLFTTETEDYIKLTTGESNILYLPVDGEQSPSADCPEPVIAERQSVSVSFVYDTQKGTAAFKDLPQE